jgi:hypothetical protein
MVELDLIQMLKFKSSTSQIFNQISNRIKTIKINTYKIKTGKTNTGIWRKKKMN